jgi:predicted  nucleic acid-binding Zn-ribbon protein
MSTLKEQIKNLLSLQEIDLHITVLRQEIEDAPKRIAELEGLLEEKNELLKKVEAEKKELDARRAELEHKIEEGERKAKRSQARISDVKNSRQHKAIMKELEDLKMLRQDWEEELLRVMEALESVNPEVEKTASEIKEIKATQKSEKAEFSSMKGKVEQDLKRLGKERKELTEALPPEVLARYDFISSRLKDAAVVPVINGTCQFCHMALPPQQYIELRRLESIMTCPHCQRIIYAVDYDD